jgi:hypothetical protein
MHEDERRMLSAIGGNAQRAEESSAAVRELNVEHGDPGG